MKVLGLDTATSIAGIAIVDGDRVLAEARHETSGRGADLLVAIDDVCRRAGIAPTALDAIAIGAGPGSFTGLRIGMATAKGIAFAAHRPLWIVSSLAALADDAARHLASRDERIAARDRSPDDEPGHGTAGRGGTDAGALDRAAPDAARGDRSAVIVAALDARRGEVFAGCFRDGVALAPERVLAPSELGAWIDQLAAATAVPAAGATPATMHDAGDAPAADALPPIYYAGDALAAHGVLEPLGPRWLPIATPSGEAIAWRALAGAREDVLLHGAPSYIRPSEAEVKYPDGVPGALRKR